MSERRAPLFAVAATYPAGVDLVPVVRALQRADFGRIDVFGPVPMPEVSALIGVRHAAVGWIGLGGALFGLAGFFFMCCWATLVDYPFLIGGRPAFSWPYFVIPSLSFGVMCGAAATLFAFLFLARLPRLNHPVFNIEGFERATQDRAFVTVEPKGDDVEPEQIAEVLRRTAPLPLALERVPR